MKQPCAIITCEKQSSALGPTDTKTSTKENGFRNCRSSFGVTAVDSTGADERTRTSTSVKALEPESSRTLPSLPPHSPFQALTTARVPPIPLINPQSAWSALPFALPFSASRRGASCREEFLSLTHNQPSSKWKVRYGTVSSGLGRHLFLSSCTQLRPPDNSRQVLKLRNPQNRFFGYTRVNSTSEPPVWKEILQG